MRNFLSYLYRKSRLFWRYRHLNPKFQTLKFLGVIIFTNVALGLYYVCYLQWMLEEGQLFRVVALLGLQVIVMLNMAFTHVVPPGFLPIIKKETDVWENESEIPPFNGRIYFNEPFSYTISCRDTLSQVKFCVSCSVFRPPLATHCKQCKRCVEEMDHHCPWLGTCIGRHNYKFYYLLLSSSSILSCLVAFLCVYGSFFKENHSWFSKIVTVSLLMIAMALGGILSFMWIIHSYFGIQGISTRSFIKGRGKGKDHPSTLTKRMAGALQAGEGKETEASSQKTVGTACVSETMVKYSSQSTTSEHFEGQDCVKESYNSKIALVS